LPASHAPVSFRIVKRIIALALVALSAACGSKDHAITSVVTPPDTLVTTTSVVFPNGTITAKIAATVFARDTGLMKATSLDANAGMLFLFAVDQPSPPQGFWMKDTSVPLSIAFLDSNKVVINVDDMTPETLTPHYATRPYRFALEVNQGWLAAHGVVAGTVVTFAIPAGTIVDP
jgi:uncharacterized membrane protein (UPF0127 family)